MNTPTPAEPVRIRREEDLLALVPVCLGFHPARSLVLLGVGETGGTFVARVDLPADTADTAALVEAVVPPTVVNGARTAFVVTYSEDVRVARHVTRAVVGRLEECGVQVMVCLRVHDGRWFGLAPGGGHLSVAGRRRRRGARGQDVGVPFDLSSHEISTRAVAQGAVVHAGREELAATLAPAAPALRDPVRSALARLRPLGDDEDVLRLEADWLARQVAARTDLPPSWADNLPPLDRQWDSVTLARVVRDVGVSELRDVVLASVTTRTARLHERLWREVLTLTPDEEVPPVAAVLSLAAWVAGDGALSACAVDRALTADPSQSLARLVADALDHALPPDQWRPARAALLASDDQPGF